MTYRAFSPRESVCCSVCIVSQRCHLANEIDAFKKIPTATFLSKGGRSIHAKILVRCMFSRKAVVSSSFFHFNEIQLL